MVRRPGLVLGSTCPLCGRPGAAPCAGCVRGLEGHLARGIGDPPPGVSWMFALFRYEGPVRRLVSEIKLAGHSDAVPGLARSLASGVRAHLPGPNGPTGRDDRWAAWPDGAVLGWVPSLPAHRRRRGFETGRLLARELGVNLGVPVWRLLARVDRSPQTGRERSGRLAGPTLVALRVPRPEAGWRGWGARRPTVAPALVILVDDVCTTGGSLAAAARALRRAGVAEVGAVVLARTPPGRADGAAHPGRRIRGKPEGQGPMLRPDRLSGPAAGSSDEAP